MLNSVCLMGRLTADPELKSTQLGVSVCNFRIAVDRTYTPKGQEKQTDFINIITWRSTAEFVSRYFRKGQLVAVQGSIQTGQYTDRDGNKRTTAEVVADNVYFGDSKRDGDGGGYSAGYSQGGYSAGGYASSAAPSGYGAPPADGDQFAELSDDDGELPF